MFEDFSNFPASIYLFKVVIESWQYVFKVNIKNTRKASLIFNRFYIFSDNSIVHFGQLNDMPYYFSVKPDLIEYSVNFLFMKHTAQNEVFY